MDGCHIDLVVVEQHIDTWMDSILIHVRPIVESMEGKLGCQRTVEQRRGTLPKVGHACGE